MYGVLDENLRELLPIDEVLKENIFFWDEKIR
jgi:hypothetical protein